MSTGHNKRKTDQQIISDWIRPQSRVLDLGCGRGVLLEYLIQKSSIHGIGVDIDLEKVQSCVKRNIPVYMGSAEDLMEIYPDRYFDWVICSRTLQDLQNPAKVILEALRVGRHLAIGFVNQGYWLNRYTALKDGCLPQNEVFTHSWEDGNPFHLITINSFEAFCIKHKITICSRIYLRGDWERHLTFAPNLRAGYAIYNLKAST
jgi:methionine biosynthesis protein MetW